MVAQPSGVIWDVAPREQLIPNLKTYQARLSDAIFRLGQYLAARMESYARVHARWTDRTGAARAGLRGFAVRQAASVIIYLVTSVWYGVILETGSRFMEPLSIIIPTIQAFRAEAMRAYRQLVGA